MRSQCDYIILAELTQKKSVKVENLDLAEFSVLYAESDIAT